MLPIFQNLNEVGVPSGSIKSSCQKVGDNYSLGLCPVTEAVNTRLLIHELIRPPMTTKDLDDVASAFIKVFDNLDKLKEPSKQKKKAEI